VEARDPRSLAAWLTDRADLQTITAGALRAEGDVKLGGDQVSIEGLTAEIDRMTMEGRVAYAWGRGDRPPRIEASLTAPDIDFDRASALAQGVFAGTPFELPREGSISLKLGRAAFAGVEARRADIDVQFERGVLDIKRLVVGDFGGAALAIKGRIDSSRAQAPRGSLSLDLDAKALDGVAALLEKVAPQAAVELRRRAARFVPAKVQASLMVGSDVPRQAAGAALKIDGSAGAFKVSLQGQTDSTEGFTLDAFSKLPASNAKLNAHLESGDGSALVELLGLDTLLAVDKRAGRLDVSASGALNGEMAMDGQLVAGALDVTTKGSLRLADGPTATAALKIANANVRSPRPVASGRPAETLPLSLTGKLAYAGGTIDLSDILGRASGAAIGGRLKIGLQPLTASGEIELAEINLPIVMATATGSPPPGGTAAWPAEPFERGLLGQVSGRIVVKSPHVALAPRLAVKNARGVIQLDQTGFAIKEIDGGLAGGRIAGEFALWRGADGVSVRSKLQTTGADIAELVRGGPPPLSGRLTGEIELEGTGRSPVALIGSLKGGGTFSLQEGGVQRLDPAAFDTVIRSVDQGLQLDATRVRDRMEQALSSGVLTVARADGEFTLVGGQARAVNVKVNAQGADVGVSGSALLADDTIDARLTLSAPERPDAPGGTRPEVTITLKGATDAPKRAIDVTAFFNWLALRAVDQQSKRIDALEAARETREKDQAAKDQGSKEQAPKDPAAASRAVPPTTGTTPPSPPAARPRPNQPSAGAPGTGSTRPQQPLDLRPPASSGGSFLDNLLGR
jgi:large subunit ribosomal protein L24